MDKALVYGIAFCDENKPYMIPMSFVYREKKLFIHTSVKSRKLDIIRKNINVSFEIDADIELVPNYEKPCETTMRYKSIVGWDKAYIISREEKSKKP